MSLKHYKYIKENVDDIVLLIEEETKSKKDDGTEKKEESPTMLKISSTIIGFVKSIYKKGEEELLGESSNIIRTLFKFGMLVASLVMLPFGINVIVAALGYFLDKIVDARITIGERNKLLLKLETELEILEEKIDSMKDKEKTPNNIKIKNNLIAFRNLTKSRISKLKTKFNAKSGLEDQKDSD
jgi:hypothetical protein